MELVPIESKVLLAIYIGSKNASEANPSTCVHGESDLTGSRPRSAPRWAEWRFPYRPYACLFTILAGSLMIQMQIFSLGYLMTRNMRRKKQLFGMLALSNNMICKIKPWRKRSLRRKRKWWIKQGRTNFTHAYQVILKSNRVYVNRIGTIQADPCLNLKSIHSTSWIDSSHPFRSDRKRSIFFM